ncbi:MAG TPA: DUF4159 domain-containing protein [Bryobacteraceae bacterium]|nr:DUF4159 domain-containing protein [Bryobacteraceae bacterium]
MKLGKALALAGCGLTVAGVLLAFQRPFREFEGVEYRIGEIPLPADYRDRAEWTFARLMFPPGEGRINGYYGRDADWHVGFSLWTQDFPRADRHFSLAVRRLTRIQVRSVEQCVNLDEGDAYDWPWLYAVQVGEWGLTTEQAHELREYLLRGGFFMADDFHGKFEWSIFEKAIKQAFPDRQIREIPDDDPIFHTVYDLKDRIQVPGQAHLSLGYKRPRFVVENDDGGRGAHWFGIYDDKDRILVAISYNSDVGDAWEFADDAWYPAKFSDQSIRMGVNYIVYAMTH